MGLNPSWKATLASTRGRIGSAELILCEVTSECDFKFTQTSALINLPDEMFFFCCLLAFFFCRQITCNVSHQLQFPEQNEVKKNKTKQLCQELMCLKWSTSSKTMSLQTAQLRR